MNNYKLFFELLRNITGEVDLIEFYPASGWDDSLVIDFSLLKLNIRKINNLINYLIINDYQNIIYKTFFDYEDAQVLTIYFKNITYKSFKKYYDNNIELFN